MPAKHKEPFILTDALAKQMERLYLSNITKYTEIAAELGIPYKTVNRHMTKWKKRMGLLKAHREITAKATPTSSIESELQFLRRFYIEHCKNELML
jgi:DNA-binding transcriptional regulator LsrR (DeoR family)